MPQYPAEISLADLDGENGFVLTGALAGDRGGWAVAAADVNGDGFADIVIGAPWAPGGDRAGAVHVVYGKAGGFGPAVDLGALEPGAGVRLAGETGDGEAGRAVAAAGDVNGDGFEDLVIGAPFGGPGLAGLAYVVFGRPDFAGDASLGALDGGSGFRIVGAAAGDSLGISVAGAGDVNGDGLDDVIVGAWRADPAGEYAGAAYVVFGRRAGFAAEIDVAALDGTDGFRLDGLAAGDRTGRGVGAAGDLNGDGVGDLIVGAHGSDLDTYNGGSAYVVYGRREGFDAAVDLAALEGTDGFRIRGPRPFERIGWSVDAAGDVNGDGLEDLLVGTDSLAGRDHGAAFVVFGRAEGFGPTLDLAALTGADGFRVKGEARYDAVGYSVSAAGDVNGDGFDDVLIGQNDSYPNGRNAGSAYVVFGRAEPFPATLDLSALDGSDGFQITPPEPLYSSRTLVAAGDVNGDGLFDLIIGQPDSPSYSPAYEGATYVVFGRRPDAAVERVGTAASQTLVGSDFDDGLSGLEGDDWLVGNGGRDRLDGGRGRDSLEGGAGADLLSGGRGADLLDGGPGDGASDRFVFGRPKHSPAEEARRDVLVGFETGLDQVDLTRLGITDFAAQARLTAAGAGVVAVFDLDRDGAFDDFGLAFADTMVTKGDFLL